MRRQLGPTPSFADRIGAAIVAGAAGAATYVYWQWRSAGHEGIPHLWPPSWLLIAFVAVAAGIGFVGGLPRAGQMWSGIIFDTRIELIIGTIIMLALLTVLVGLALRLAP